MALTTDADAYLVLTMGNSQLRWAAVQYGNIQAQSSLPSPQPASRSIFPRMYQNAPLFIVSVVPEQLPGWTALPQSQVLTLADIPLAGQYPTLGCDRAIAAYGAIQRYGAPVLVMDGGTAWTFTAINAEAVLIGGAILPGLALQYQSLHQGTGALPHLPPTEGVPTRWGQDTIAAIHSGIHHLLLAGAQDFLAAWQQDYPQGAVVLTGGSGAWLQRHLVDHGSRLYYNPDLLIQSVVALVNAT
ncbi:MAG: type III pantothenate kinase [Cyanobacteria bacterium P01_G01_bin.54]